jgi:hypothetical protein
LTPVWREDADALAVYVIFDDPIPAGAERQIVFTWTWPGFYRRLLAGSPDRIFFVRKVGSAQAIRQRINFDATCDLADCLRIRPYDGSPVPRQERDADGSVTIEVEYGPEALPSVVGFVAQRGDRLLGDWPAR